MAAFERKWGDDGDDDESTAHFLPPNTVEGPDKRGVKTVTEYEYGPEGKTRIKIVKKFRVVKRSKKISARAKERRESWKKFGACINDGDGPNPTNTILSHDEIRMEHPDAEEQDKAVDIMDKLAEGMRRRQKNQLYKDYGIDVPESEKDVGDEITGLRRDPSEMIGASGLSSNPNRWVPSARSGAGSRYEQREESNTLRVSNISEDATERDVRALCETFGPVHRVYLAKDKETQMSRGFAYISYRYKKDADEALEKLNGYGYDHLILKVERAKPSNRDPGTSSGLSGGFTSGYGKALPQDMRKN